jgi:phosphopantothenoylcysteine decarboxylase/phosphopantothenate--cysteine ligase
LDEKRVLLIVGGGIAAYKALELVRLLRKAGVAVRPILTRAGAQFVTPLSLSALAEDKVYADLFSLTDEAEMGHIELSRSAELVVVAPATADLLAKAANGHADDLASTTLLATDKPVLMAPAMNVPPPAGTWRSLPPMGCGSWVPMRAPWPAANSGRAAWPSRRRSSRRSWGF